jgi:hypothetical protein
MSDTAANQNVRDNLTKIVDLPTWKIDTGMQLALAKSVTAEQAIARIKDEGFVIFFGGHILTKENIYTLSDGTEVLLEQNGSSVRSWLDTASAFYTQKGDGEKPLMWDVDYIRNEFVDAWPKPARNLNIFSEGELAREMEHPPFQVVRSKVSKTRSSISIVGKKGTFALTLSKGEWREVVNYDDIIRRVLLEGDFVPR